MSRIFKWIYVLIYLELCRYHKILVILVFSVVYGKYLKLLEIFAKT